ncbi:MAG: SsrA-binding protein SmpB [Bacteroidales bacterium]|jgi:SsrA-binding protein|nr:SsrA-binding protein SmpB [Bacteroidales bacterium]MBQ2376450.1 SsrA-binding protein SmpB [Bacteroidales bacterium]MBQ5873149.1 SsrA-binding protein SmpB [Bacteroidales bacterium]MBQ5892507.1 SsrA-binding protein SmpB [Bacteroidales bacterium]MEE0883336.1 SsrA-binding protein SmpB [Bacteroidales bacterium]
MQVEEKHLIDIKNKKAGFEYFFVQTFRAGLVLYGTEIKSIREGKVNLSDSYCLFSKGELWVHDMHISEYRFGSYYNHQAKRTRKLLLKKNELRKLENKSKEKGFTIIPTLLFVDERGYAKLEIALCKGKHSYDKRETIKLKDNKRELERALKY